MFEKIKIKLLNIRKNIPAAAFIFLLVLPASTNYQLKDFGFGSGGAGNASSSNYSMSAIAGEQGGSQSSSAGYKIGSGLIFTNQSNVPSAPSFSNPDNYYNKLKIILDVSGNPTDTKYAIAISSDDFVTTNFVQNDNTIGLALGAEDYQTYSAWGGASGFFVAGLSPNTEYKVKAKAMQGKFTETGYGPIATASTINPTLSFSISANSINFGNLTAGTVADSPQNIVVDFATNGASGGKVFIIGQNGGLLSAVKSYMINSISGDLASLAQGFGAQGVSAAQSSGGPLAISSPYDVSANNVGIVDSSVREIFSSANPVSGGQGTFLLKAKSSFITPAASDYRELLTVVASGNF